MARKNGHGDAVVNDADRANLLNEYFCSVNVVDDGVVPNINAKSDGNKLENIIFNRNVITKAIRKSKPNMSAGPDLSLIHI